MLLATAHRVILVWRFELIWQIPWKDILQETVVQLTEAVAAKGLIESKESEESEESKESEESVDSEDSEESRKSGNSGESKENGAQAKDSTAHLSSPPLLSHPPQQEQQQQQVRYCCYYCLSLYMYNYLFSLYKCVVLVHVQC